MLRKTADILERFLGTPDIARGIQAGLLHEKSQGDLASEEYNDRDRRLIEARNFRRVNLALTGGLNLEEINSLPKFVLRTSSYLAMRTVLKMAKWGEIERAEDDKCVLRLRNGAVLFGK